MPVGAWALDTGRPQQSYDGGGGGRGLERGAQVEGAGGGEHLDRDDPGQAVDGLTRVVAIEVLTAARALDMRAPLEPSRSSRAVVQLLRESGIAGPGPDRHLSPEIEAAVELVRAGSVLTTVEEVIGELR